MVRFSTKFGDVPVIVASASLPGAPVVTVPIVSVGVSASAPVAPVAPVGPVAPVAPVGPVGPVAPVAPVAPVGPVHPTKSVKNNQNIENKDIETHSRYTFFDTKS